MTFEVSAAAPEGVAADVSDLPVKRCTLCKEAKPLGDFHVRSGRKGGRQSKCKPCACAIAATRRSGVKDGPAFKAAAKDRTRQWREKNPERGAAARKAWQAANREKTLEYLKLYRARRPGASARRPEGYVTAAAAARRARKRAAMPLWADREAIATLYREARARSEETGTDWHVDHIVPLKHPLVCGLHIPTNLQLLTAAENMRKRNSFTV